MCIRDRCIGVGFELFVSHNGGCSWRLIQFDHLYFSIHWIYYPLIILNILLFAICIGFFLFKNKIKNGISKIRIFQSFKTSFNLTIDSILEIKTKRQKVVLIFFMMWLFYSFNFLFLLIHELSHAFAVLLYGGYVESLEINFLLFGCTYIKGTFTDLNLILIHFAGLLGELIVGVLLILFTFNFFKGKKLIYFLSIIITVTGIVIPIFQFMLCPLFLIKCDVCYIARILDISPFIISIYFIPFLVISIYFLKNFILKFLKVS